MGDKHLVLAETLYIFEELYVISRNEGGQGPPPPRHGHGGEPTGGEGGGYFVIKFKL